MAYLVPHSFQLGNVFCRVFESEMAKTKLHRVAFALFELRLAWAALDQHRNTKIVHDDFGCGECDGSCFGGHCLFNVLDDAAPPLSQQRNDPLESTAGGISEQQRAEAVLQSPPGSAENALPIAYLLRSSKGEQQALEGDVAFLSTETSSLRAHLRADELELQDLRSQKQQFQHQLRIWSNGLADIEDREARMAELLGLARNGSVSSSGKSNGWVDRYWEYTEDSVTLWIKNLPHTASNFVQFMKDAVFLIGFVIALALIYIFRSRFLMLLFDTEEIKLSWQDVVWTCLSCGHYCWPLEPLGRALGIAYQTVEISEIQLGHLLVGGDVYVQIDIGTNPLLNTRTINKSDGVFLRFNSIFKVNVRKTENPCVFKVFDQDVLLHDQIAQLEINAWEFVNLARKGSADANSGYFRFDLQHRERRLKSGKLGKSFTNPDGVRPYIAMRLREVTDTNDRYHGTLGTFRAKNSQKEFLHAMDSQPGETHFKLDPNTNELQLP